MTFFAVSKTTGDAKVSTSNSSVAWYSGYGNDQALSYTNNTTSAQLFSKKIVTTSVALETFRYNGSNKLIRYNTYGKTAAATGNLGLSGGLTIGALSGGGFDFGGDISEILVYNRALTDGEITQVEDYLISKYNVTTSLLPLVGFEGDSITYGAGQTPYPTQTLASLGGLGYGVCLIQV